MAAAAEVGLRGLGAALARMATVTALDAPAAAAVFTSIDDLIAWIERHTDARYQAGGGWANA